jgi:membrane protease YdiL (CAAX protease family)
MTLPPSPSGPRTGDNGGDKRGDSGAVDAPGRPYTARSLRVEIVIVFLVTLGLSGLTSLVSLIDALLAPVPLASQTVSIVVPRAQASLLDLVKQLLAIVGGLAWGALGLYLLWRSGVNLRTRLGLDRTRLGRDAAAGVVLAAVVGIPGLLLYVLAVQIGVNLTVAPTALDDAWWRLPILVLAALENGFLEEVLVVGYLITRLDQLRVPAWATIALSAVLRGAYHLYQGLGGFVGNAIMGVLFAWLFRRTRRLWPLVIAHTLLDVAAFVGYALLRDQVSWLP